MQSAPSRTACELSSTDSTDLGIHPIFDRTLGDSPVMKAVERLVVQASQHTFPVLVLGETGTGKELIARLIHNLGPRRLKPFVPVDCVSVTPTLIESELFGHTRGAFTGAGQVKHGLFEVADQGTLFFDEVGDFPLELQSKVLRSMQEKKIRPIGSTEYISLNFRVIAATNRNLSAAVESGQFRRDLYYRLSVVEIKLPPLRERKRDIPLLVNKLLGKYVGGREVSLSDGGLRRLLSYDWPGNVRELENALVRAVALSPHKTLGADDFPLNFSLNDVSASLMGSDQGILPWRELERRAILSAVNDAGGDKLAAARILGIGKTTLYRKLAEYEKQNEIVNGG